MFVVETEDKVDVLPFMFIVLNELPIVTEPVLVPVFMLVLKFDDVLIFVSAPLDVKPVLVSLPLLSNDATTLLELFVISKISTD